MLKKFLKYNIRAMSIVLTFISIMIIALWPLIIVKYFTNLSVLGFSMIMFIYIYLLALICTILESKK